MKIDVKKELQQFNSSFEEIINAFDVKPCNKEIIRVKYSQLKAAINDKIKALEKRKNDLQEIETFYLPALRGAIGHLKVKTNGKIDQYLLDSLIDAKVDIDCAVRGLK